MKRLDRRQMMRSIAISRVLDNPMERNAIGSTAQLREACQRELAEHGETIAAEVDRLFAIARATDRRILAGNLRCVACDGPMPDIRRISRRYCSDRCRQRAYRERAGA